MSDLLSTITLIILGIASVIGGFLWVKALLDAIRLPRIEDRLVWSVMIFMTSLLGVWLFRACGPSNDSSDGDGFPPEDQAFLVAHRQRHQKP